MPLVLTIDLATTHWTLSNGSHNHVTQPLSGTLADGDVFVAANSQAAQAILDVADMISGAVNWNGDDAVVLRKNEDGAVVDSIGQIGTDPGSEWPGGGQNDTMQRKAEVCAGDTNPDDAFNAAEEWDILAQDKFDGLGNHTISCGAIVDTAPEVASTNPADTTTDASIHTDITIDFSEDVIVNGAWFEISCSTSGAHSAAVSGGPASYTLDPDVSFTSGDVCTVTIFGANVIDQDETPDPMVSDYSFVFTAIDSCVLDYTPAYAIQGNGPSAAITGPVTTQGVVVGDYEGSSPALRGFYLQDLVGDGDSSTSDAIFVFNGNNNSVSLGDVVRVTGNAGEFQNQTQISSSAIVACGAGSVEPTDVTLPFSDSSDPERYEGMLMRMPQTLYVTEHYQLGRFGQVTLSANGRLAQPTNVTAPGTAANDLQAANDLNRIIFDDGLNDQNPDPIVFGRGGQPLSAANTFRGGDTATNTIGVFTYTWAGNSASGNAYRLRPLNALGGFVNFDAGNLRPATPAPVGGTIKLTGMNLLNFFNTFDGQPDNVDNCAYGIGGAPADCRGADTQSEFDRQWPKTVTAIIGTNADIIGIVEIENDGYGHDSAIQFLVDQLNAATVPGTYAFVDADTATNQVNALGTDAIKVGLIYKTANVSPIGNTAVLNSEAFINGGDSEPRNRASLAQAFQETATGANVIVNVNHLKSKGSACDIEDAGDGQGNCNIVRTNAANELMDWLASDPTGTGDPDILILGDMNAYAMEDPITAVLNRGFTDLNMAFGGPNAYSYVFDGQWGYLDHALASASLAAQVTGVTEWHVNSDEPNVLDYNTNFKSPNQIAILYSQDQYRASDHDPVIVGLAVCDDIPPTFDEVSVTPDVLWPPNHQLVDVAATVVVNDNFDPNPTVQLVSVTSSELDNSLGDGDSANDIVTVDDFTFQLRAERSGRADGRVYTITYSATDACGNSAQQSAEVLVPANQGKGPKNKNDDAEVNGAGVDILPEDPVDGNQIYLPIVTN